MAKSMAEILEAAGWPSAAQQMLNVAQVAAGMPWPYNGVIDRYMQEHSAPAARGSLAPDVDWNSHEPNHASPAVSSHTARLEAEIAELRQHVIRMQTEIMALQARVKAVEPKGVMPGAALRHGVP